MLTLVGSPVITHADSPQADMDSVRTPHPDRMRARRRRLGRRKRRSLTFTPSTLMWAGSTAYVQRLHGLRHGPLAAHRLLFQAVGHCPCRYLGATAESEPVQDVLDLRPGRSGTGIQLQRDLIVRTTSNNQDGHRLLVCRQLIGRSWRRGEGGHREWRSPFSCGFGGLVGGQQFARRELLGKRIFAERVAQSR